MRSLTPWNPMELSSLGSLATFTNDFERLMRRGQTGPTGQATHLVRLDWTESDDEVTLRAEVPGVAAEDLEITVAGNLLTLAGEKTLEPKVEGEDEKGPSYSERSFGAFRRQVKLPFAVATDQVRAESAHGVVTIHLPKAEAERSRRIEVKTTS